MPIRKACTVNRECTAAGRRQAAAQHAAHRRVALKAPAAPGRTGCAWAELRRKLYRGRAICGSSATAHSQSTA